MVAMTPTEQGAWHDAGGGNESASRHYDSFLVRLWQDEKSDAMLRVEVQHVQAGLSVEAMQVPLDWILPEIWSCLQSGSEGANTRMP